MDRAIRTDRLTTKGVEGGGVTVHTEDQVERTAGAREATEGTMEGGTIATPTKQSAEGGSPGGTGAIAGGSHNGESGSNLRLPEPPEPRAPSPP